MPRRCKATVGDNKQKHPKSAASGNLRSSRVQRCAGAPRKYGRTTRIFAAHDLCPSSRRSSFFGLCNSKGIHHEGDNHVQGSSRRRTTNFQSRKLKLFEWRPRSFFRFPSRTPWQRFLRNLGVTRASLRRLTCKMQPPVNIVRKRTIGRQRVNYARVTTYSTSVSTTRSLRIYACTTSTAFTLAPCWHQIRMHHINSLHFCSFASAFNNCKPNSSAKISKKRSKTFHLAVKGIQHTSR